MEQINCCRSQTVKGTTLTVHLYPSIRTKDRYDNEAIWKAIFEAHQKASEALDLAAFIDVIVFESGFVMPEYGFGANTDNFDAITVRLSRDHKGIMESVKKYLPALLAHELHHAARQRKLPYWDHTTLKDAMVSEGLAENFQEELYPDSPLHINKEFSASELKQWESKARKLFDSTDYNYDGWFYGDDTMPRWIGYTLGYKLVKAYLKKHSKTAAESAQLPGAGLDL